MRMGRVLQRLEALDRELQSRQTHPSAAIMGPGSLHASIVNGGRELSSYPDRCRLQIERRTIGEHRQVDIVSEGVAWQLEVPDALAIVTVGQRKLGDHIAGVGGIDVLGDSLRCGLVPLSIYIRAGIHDRNLRPEQSDQPEQSA